MRSQSFTATVSVILCNGQHYVQFINPQTDAAYYAAIQEADAEELCEDEMIILQLAEQLPEGYIFNPQDDCNA